jgi:PadR family transcriptional regulator AphA
VQVFFAEVGTRAQLLNTLAAARRWSEEQTLATSHVPEEYLQGRGPFPARLPWLILVGAFLDDFVAMVDRWATWATEVVDGWPDDLSQARPELAVLDQFVTRAAEVRGRAGSRAHQR